MDPIEITHLQAQIAKLNAETFKLLGEGSKYRRETDWYPFVVGAAVMAAATGLVTVAAKLIS